MAARSCAAIVSPSSAAPRTSFKPTGTAKSRRKVSTRFGAGEGAAFVVGVRRNLRNSIVRTLLTKVVAVLNSMLFGCILRDANCPFRLYSGSHLAAVLPFMPVRASVPNILLSVTMKRLGFPIREVPLSKAWLRRGSNTLTPRKLYRICVTAFGEIVQRRRFLAREKARLAEIAAREEAKCVRNIS